MIFAERWSRKTGQFFPERRKIEVISTPTFNQAKIFWGSRHMVFFKFLCRKICYLLDLLPSPVRLPHSVSLARPQPSAPSSILDAVQHAATQERCASRRRSSVDGTARALRAAAGNGATVARKQTAIPCTLPFQFAKSATPY